MGKKCKGKPFKEASKQKGAKARGRKGQKGGVLTHKVRKRQRKENDVKKKKSRSERAKYKQPSVLGKKKRVLIVISNTQDARGIMQGNIDESGLT